MPNTRDIRRRIKSIKNTAQITKAMQLVAASKMRRAQEQAVSGRAFADLLNTILVNLKDAVDEEQHPLLERRGEGGRELAIVVSTDKGLCGGLNTNLLKKFNSQVSEGAEIVTVGSKLRRSLANMGANLVADFHVKDPVLFLETKRVSKFATERFLDRSVDRVRIYFTNFVNTLVQVPMAETILPITSIDLGQRKSYEGAGQELGEIEKPPVAGYLFEPTPESVLDAILPMYLNYAIYQMVLEARASEHSARMVAMKSATDNAEQLAKDLTLEYNKVRQAAITTELLEITTAQKALE
jgi:F-type H+-transporting ATPase subunit gamma